MCCCRKFRMKTFALMGFQLALVLAITVSVDYVQLWGAMMPTLGQTPAQVVFYVIGAINFTSILALQNFKDDRYPLNYLLLCVTTVLSGIFWGLKLGRGGVGSMGSAGLSMELTCLILFG
eukprot:g29182.t1